MSERLEFRVVQELMVEDQKKAVEVGLKYDHEMLAFFKSSNLVFQVDWVMVDLEFHIHFLLVVEFWYIPDTLEVGDEDNRGIVTEGSESDCLNSLLEVEHLEIRTMIFLEVDNFFLVDLVHQSNQEDFGCYHTMDAPVAMVEQSLLKFLFFFLMNFCHFLKLIFLI